MRRPSGGGGWDQQHPKGPSGPSTKQKVSTQSHDYGYECGNPKYPIVRYFEPLGTGRGGIVLLISGSLYWRLGGGTSESVYRVTHTSADRTESGLKGCVDRAPLKGIQIRVSM